MPFGLYDKLSFRTINILLYIAAFIGLCWLIYYSTHVFPGVYQ